MSATLLPPLLFASTEASADALWFGRVEVPDAFVAFGTADGRRVAVLRELEYARVKRDGRFDEVLPAEDWWDPIRKEFPELPNRTVHARMIKRLATKFSPEGFRVGETFPTALAFALRDEGVRLEVADGPLFPERLVKGPAECAGLRAGNRAASAGFAAVERVLAAAAIAPDGALWWEGAPLTSERLRREVFVACLDADALALHTILAGGTQACDPHLRGSGPLRAGELIIADIFPRHDSGYYGDMTRTYLKGHASDAQRRLVATVAAAQQLALGQIRAGADPRQIHKSVEDFFKAEGYPKEKRGDVNVGFIHGTGHGLGLEVHEPPRLSPFGPEKLAAGTAVTVEPGLYFPDIGGCRIEDVVLVTETGCEFLSSHPYAWEIA